MIPAHPHRRELNPFFGREWERQRLIEDLEGGRALLTITGLSGIGKSRLAHAVATEVAAHYDAEGGIWFCGLGGCESSGDVERAIARAMGIVRWSPGKLGPLLARRRRTLLILDNGEHLARELAALLEPWLRSGPNLQVVVTSIVPLEIEGENRHELGPLAPDAAAALFIDRARAAGHAVSAAERPIVEQLVGRLGRVPLSIELAAAKVRLLPPADLLASIDRPSDPALQSARESLRGSLTDAVARTWAFLSAEERRTLAGTSIFAGSFTLDAAIEVLRREEDAVAILDRLDGLRGKALLSIQESEASRFSLIEGIQAFAAQKLDESGEREALALRHAQHFVRLGEVTATRLDGEGYLEALRVLRAERDNLLVALEAQLVRAPALAARLGLVLGKLARVEGAFLSGIATAERTLLAAQASGAPGLLLRATIDLILFRVETAPGEEVLERLDEALAMATRLGAPLERASILVERSRVLEALGDGAAALAGFAGAAREAKLAGSRRLEALAIIRQAEVYINHFRDPVAAEECFERGQAILHGNRLERTGGHAFPSLQGAIRMLQGRFREGRRAFEAALRSSEAVGSPHREATDQLNLTWLESATGRLKEAREHGELALRHFERAGLSHGEGLARYLLGVVALELGDSDEAEAALTEAVGILEEWGNRLVLARALGFLAVAEARGGHFADAERSLADARAYFEERRLTLDLRGLELLERCVDLSRALQVCAEDPAGAERLVEAAREQLASARVQGERTMPEDVVGLLEAELERWERREPAAAAPGREGLLVAKGAEWFEPPGKDRVDLRRRNAIRHMLAHLVERRLERPGAGIDPRELFAVGWPGVQVGLETENKRVYIGIWTLRSLGLAGILLNQVDGYLLDPEVPVAWGRS